MGEGCVKNPGKLPTSFMDGAKLRKINELLQEYILDLDAWVTELLHLIQRAHVASSNR